MLQGKVVSRRIGALRVLVLRIDGANAGRARQGGGIVGRRAETCLQRLAVCRAVHIPEKVIALVGNRVKRGVHKERSIVRQVEAEANVFHTAVKDTSPGAQY